MTDKILKVLSYVLLAVGIVVVIFPFLWAILMSFKDNAEILSIPPTFLPENVYTDGYKKVLTETPIMYWFLNSLIVAVVTVTGTCFTSALGGYIFAKYDFRFKKVLFVMVLATMMVPFQVIMIPIYIICAKLHLIDTLWALILPGLVSGFGIFLCRQFIEEIPNELIEAARMEGASEFKVFLRIILPNIKPTVSALAIFTFVAKWNDYQWPLIAISDEKKMTLPLALKFFESSQISDLNATMSASVVIIIPIVIIFLIFQKQFIEGMTISGMK